MNKCFQETRPIKAKNMFRKILQHFFQILSLESLSLHFFLCNLKFGERESLVTDEPLSRHNCQKFLEINNEICDVLFHLVNLI